MLLENMEKAEELLYDRNFSKKIQEALMLFKQVSRGENIRTNFFAGYREYASFFSELE